MKTVTQYSKSKRMQLTLARCAKIATKHKGFTPSLKKNCGEKFLFLHYAIFACIDFLFFLCIKP